MALEPDKLELARKRLTQVFQFLRDLNQHRNPAIRRIGDQPWVLWFRDLPQHPSIRRGTIDDTVATPPDQVDSADTNRSDDFILRVARAAATRPPDPPAELAGWLEKGWDDPFAEVRVIESREVPRPESQDTIVERFDADEKRQLALATWKARRDEWARNERPARQSLRIFERLYDLRSSLEREAERLELVLGEGILAWHRSDGDVHHPVLLQSVELEFDPDVPEFIIREKDTPLQLYTPLFAGMHGINGTALGRCNDELREQQFHPLGGAATSAFLKRLLAALSPRFEFLDQPGPITPGETPRLVRDPVLFLRTRSMGFTTAIESILEDIRTTEDLSRPLISIVGVEAPPAEDMESVRSAFANEDTDILLSKPANPEQLQIAHRLNQKGRVLVQGPPGTGKTHTIANLIGHLLAQGNTILVTSHTAKALRVLQDKVVSEIRPLCLSVLGHDLESKEQLKASIEHIVHRLSNDDPDTLEKEAEALDRQRRQLIERIGATRKRLLDIREGEYREIVVAGVGYQPSQAARYVVEQQEEDGWIPGPVTPGAPLPLSRNEIFELYRTNSAISTDDDAELSSELPAPEDLLSPHEFALRVQELDSLSTVDTQYRIDLWTTPARQVDADQLNQLADDCRALLQRLERASQFELALMQAGFLGETHRQVWDELIGEIEATAKTATNAQPLILQHAPVLPSASRETDVLPILNEILTHLEAGRSLNRLALLLHGQWKKLIEESRVGSERPQTVDHFRALQALCERNIARRRLIERWNRQVAEANGPSSEVLGDTPEVTAGQFASRFEGFLAWRKRDWEPFERRLVDAGLRWDALLDEQEPVAGPTGVVIRLRAALAVAERVLTSRGALLRRHFLEQELLQFSSTLSRFETQSAGANVVALLQQAIRQRAGIAYEAAHRRLAGLHRLTEAHRRRMELLRKLETVASAWAKAIRNRQSPHDGSEPPGDPERAWIWLQLRDELDRRSAESLPELAKQLEDLSATLQTVTAKLIEKRAWARQIRRITPEQRRALVGLYQTWNKRGFATGKRSTVLQAAARRLMAQSQTAVPVWIMPMARVAESFDPRTTRFDVVIIDEASQSDAIGLIAPYLGRQVIVVGDPEQNSPVEVGQKLDVVERLIDQHLIGIPNKHLYDGETSLYEIAERSFGHTICLTEHFRCVPEIIEFSNQLSYEGKLKPLRDSASARIKPAIIEYRTSGTKSSNKVNREEALTVASLIAAAIEQPEYAIGPHGEPLTFGVVSLLGEEQAIEIDRLLRQHLSPSEYQRRQILCGNSPQFQGDERDVIFLSLVDSSPEDGPLPLRAEKRYRQRFNVAASRARDQMWIVHSLNANRDLKPDDLRRQLIEHARDPFRFRRQHEQGAERVESEFERQVLRRLREARYRVTPQWEVGQYRIDLVVEGRERKLAVECDGDRFHGLDKLPDDMKRQAILERCGWTFHRIRGSEFFRDPEGTIQRLFDRLSAMGIEPEILDDAPPQPEPDANELIQRVIRRAAEVRREWQDDDSASLVVGALGITAN